MRIITWKELRLSVPYSRQHVARLEKEGRFPKRVRLGDSPRGRVGWIEGEIDQWLQSRIDRRDEPVAEAAE